MMLITMGHPDGATLAQLDDIAKNAKDYEKETHKSPPGSPNMRRGKNKK